MRTELFDYVLPEENIAQRPTADRDGARLLVLERSGVSHRGVREFAELVPSGSLVVVNETRVLRARLIGVRSPDGKGGGGGRVELFLLHRVASLDARRERWAAMGRANRPLRAGTRVEIGALVADVAERADDGTLLVDLSAEVAVGEAIARFGHVPLPPYVRRDDDAADGERYQTVFAKHEGSVAAPTAGLHLTEAMIQRLRERRVEVDAITLHVGLGTFRPVLADDLDEHPMHAEYFEVSGALADRVAAARSRGGIVVGVGTTVVRALESARDAERPGCVRETAAWTRLLIQPGYRFGVVDALLTNFHMPKSTLLALVAAFTSRERMMTAYRAAIESGYRFLSYGDAMWIPERLE